MLENTPSKTSSWSTPKRWADDIRIIVGKNWMRTAQNRKYWSILKEAYTVQWMNNGYKEIFFIVDKEDKRSTGVSQSSYCNY